MTMSCNNNNNDIYYVMNHIVSDIGMYHMFVYVYFCLYLHKDFQHRDKDMQPKLYLKTM